MILLLFLATVGAFLFVLTVAVAGPVDHKIDALPGWFPRELPSAQYSGFVDADASDYLKMHYWFVECEEDPVNAPLVLWFNGGPGASSLYGLMVELGPFLVSDLSLSGPEYEATGVPQLIYNPYGWQKVANVLALSIPPPVGFSFCNPPGPAAVGNDCGAWNDTSTAEVTYYAIRSWLELFPEYKENEMFLLGESYAGVYVPTIVQQILAHPEDGMNLQGFGVGDACTPPEICGSNHYGPYYQIQFLYGKSAFSNQLYEEIFTVCSTEELINGDLSDICSQSVAKMDAEVGGYWVYGYYDNCWYENDIRRRRLWAPKGEDGEDGWPAGQQRYYGPPIARTSAVGITPNEDQFVGGNGYACGGPGAQALYLDLPEVKRALNLPQEATFFQCDNGQDFTYSETEKDVISFYKEVIAEGKLRVIVYNGDTDPCISAFQAQNWTSHLGFAETESWRAWTLDGCQSVGGYVTRYENNFDFLTVKGSGHMVPLHRPQASLEFLSRFLRGEDYKQYDSSCSAPPATGSDRSVYSEGQTSTAASGKGSAEEVRLLQEMENAEQQHRAKMAQLQLELLRASQATQTSQ